MSSSESEGMLMFSTDSSDKEDELLLLVAIEEEQAASQGRSRQRGSVPGHVVIDCGHREDAARLFRDYFTNNPVYGDALFRHRLTDGTEANVSYTVNGNRYDMGYYLGDAIYPEWATISRFAIIRGLTRVWDKSTLQNIMTACVIMHNMIIEDKKGGAASEDVFDYMGEKATVHRDPDQALLHYVEATEAIRNRALHHQLREDLMEHLWSLHGAQ
ncbi:uncharacterized protein LOC133886310 [Phragmites australis]|uniref:uncharacterized protein LOC133886310 n=1 Tax=Phragmites australis TaxID=29695 RepID=UPI002D765FC3|nr:uncharacterized protein LOC133886310 [Phragmites australis]